MGGPREIFQKSPQRQPSFERPKSNLAQMALSCNWYALKEHTNLNPHFLKKCKGGTKGNFSKIAKKVALAEKAQQHSGATGIILAFLCTYSAKIGEDFRVKEGSKSIRIVKLLQFWEGHPKPAFSEKLERGDQGKFFKNDPKGNPRLKGPKPFWRKKHYPLFSMHLKSKDWRRF